MKPLRLVEHRRLRFGGRPATLVLPTAGVSLDPNIPTTLTWIALTQPQTPTMLRFRKCVDTERHCDNLCHAKDPHAGKGVRKQAQPAQRSVPENLLEPPPYVNNPLPFSPKNLSLCLYT